MLTTICDDTWYVLNMQPITANSKRWIYSDIPCGGHTQIKDLTTWLKVATALENPPPTPTHKISRSYYHWQKWCKKSKDMATEVKTQFSHFQATTPFSILICLSRSGHKAWSNIEEVLDPIVFQGHPSNFKVTQQKIDNFYPRWSFPDCNSSLKSLMATEWCTNLDVEEVPYYFSRSSVKF